MGHHVGEAATAVRLNPREVAMVHQGGEDTVLVVALGTALEAVTGADHLRQAGTVVAEAGFLQLA
jgi:hypothetical protein